ncbi:MAG: ABC transporter permease [Eubacteriaceae bacterium]|jgi:peptide/nickel transport system permease protein|nr:ABC transporter permease [Eubacteriaceae bacterium]
MAKYLVGRVLSMIPLLVLISILAFALVHMMPGDPLEMMINPGITSLEMEKQRERLGLNDSVLSQYFAWIGQILRGNLGFSISSYEPISKILMERIPATLLLMGTSMLISLLIAVPVGVITAKWQYTKLDYAFTAFSIFGISMPSFFLGLCMIFLFSVKLGLFPTGMMTTPGSAFSIGDLLHHLALPAIVLGINGAAQYTRYVRAQMIEILRQDYIRTARAKGTSESKVTFAHGLRNGLMPVITLLGMQLPSLLGGAVITEQIFSWPGIGRLMVKSVFARDYPVMMALILITAVLVVLGNLLADIFYAVADPRVKLGA